MHVYFITLIIVMMLTSSADRCDCFYENQFENGVVVHSRRGKRLLIAAAVILMLVAGLRYNVGDDYGAYEWSFQRYYDSLTHSIVSLDEPGYSLLARIASLLGGRGKMAIFLASVVTVGLSLKVIFSNADRTSFPVFLYITIGCFTSSFNAIRQGLAVAFVFSGYQSLRDKKLIRYVFCTFAAYLFHKSAIIMIVLYFIIRRRVNFKNVLLLLVGTLIVLQFYSHIYDFTQDVLDKSLSGDYEYFYRSVNIFRVLVGCTPAAYFFIQYGGNKMTKLEEFNLNILLIHAALNIVTLNSAYLARICLYTEPFVALSIPELLKYLSENKRRSISLLIGFSYFIFWCYTIFSSDSLRVFKWVWQ